MGALGRTGEDDLDLALPLFVGVEGDGDEDTEL